MSKKFISVISLLLFVSLLQGIGSSLARRTTNRALFRHSIEIE